MKDKLPIVLIIAFTALIIVFLAILSSKTSGTSSNTGNPSNPLSVGSSEIDFTLPDLNNKNYTLSDYKGKNIVILEFFAVWCPHCQRETSMMDDLYTKYNSKGVVFLNVQASQYGRNYESGDTTLATISDLKWFRDNFNVPNPILQDYNITIANKYGVQGFPTFYIISKTGKITYTTSGETPESTLSSQLDHALSLG